MPALAVAVVAFVTFLPAPLAFSATGNDKFFNEFNRFVGKWKGRGIGRRNAASAKEVVSCKGLHRWLKKGRLFEQSYTCWGADFIFSGSIHLAPGAGPGAYTGVSLNGAKEQVGKVSGRKLKSGILEFTLNKKFGKLSRTAKLNMLKNGKISYSISKIDKTTGKPLEILKIVYAKRIKK